MATKVLVLGYQDIIPNVLGDSSNYYLRTSTKFTDLDTGRQELVDIDTLLDATDNLITIENKVRDSIVVRISEFGVFPTKADILMPQLK